MQSVFHNDEIETEILRASSTSEFSHSLGQNRKTSRRHMFSGLPSKADITLRTRHVRFVPPLADMRRDSVATSIRASFGHIGVGGEGGQPLKDAQ